MNFKQRSRSGFKEKSSDLRKVITVSGCMFLLLTVEGSNLWANSFMNPSQQVIKLSSKMQDVTVQEVLASVEQQTDYHFTYNPMQIGADRRVTIDLNNKSVTEILDELFLGKKVQYVVEGNNIVLFADNKKAEVKDIVQQKSKIVTGTVLDVTGMPVIGANVTVKGTTQGTITDMDGKFSLEVAEGDILQVTYIGFANQEVKVGTQTNLSVTLKEDAEALDELVVVGYGTQKKVNLTGAVASISPEEIQSRPITNVTQALQGITPGLNITASNTYGGEVGSPMDMNIRGIGSLTEGSGKPYVLVDGVPMDLSLVNPNDIENISVLKDAASAAIYGARAAYGVILVTTKSGSKGEKFQISYNANFGWKTPTMLQKTSNALDYANAVNESCRNSGISPLYSDEVVELIKQNIVSGGTMAGILPDPTSPNKFGEYDQTYANTDWTKVYYKDWAFQNSHDISISGATDKSNYYAGLGYTSQDGQLNFFDENYKRYNVTVNNSTQLTKWLKFKLNSKFAYSKKNVPVGYGGTDRTVNYHMMARAYPTLPVYNPNGDFTESCNVAQILSEGGSEKESTTTVYITPSFEINVLDDLKINGDFTYNYVGSDRDTHFAKVNVGNVDGTTTHLHHANNFNKIEEEQSSVTYTTGNIYASYAKDFNKHHIDALVGGQIEYNSTKNLIGSKRDLITDEVPSIGTATGLTDLRDEMSEWSTLGSFIRLNYSFDDRYMLSFNGRYDGSSRFRSGKQWGFFPSFSGAYNMHREKFWKPISPYVNTFKLRASYGTLGNQEVPNYLFYETIPVKTNLSYIINGARPIYTQTPDLVSWNLTWEESRTLNVGGDISFLDNRLSGSFDWYTRETVNMFGPAEALPAVLGKDAPKMNNASLRTTGIELSLTWKQHVNDDFSYSITGTLSDNQTEVTKYNNPTKIISSSTYYEGQKLGDIWGYVTEGFFTSPEDVKNSPDQSAIYATWNPGDMKYKDLNGDNKIDWGDNTAVNPGDKKVIGNDTPRFLYGLSFSGIYKDFDFNLFFQGVGKRDVFIGSMTYFGFQGSKFFTTVHDHNLDYWREDNQDAFFARPYATSEVDKNQQVQSRFIQNGAYLRLKNLQIGYTLPKHLLQNTGIDRLRFYFSGENLLTFTKLMDGIDPEATGGNYGDGKSYPMSLVCSFGVNVSF